MNLQIQKIRNGGKTMLLKSGDQGIQVKYLQQGLKIMCCNPGSIDSSFGPGTQVAVRKFQEEWGIAVDGIVGDETWNCLINEIAPIQQALKKKGFYSGVITGVAKENTYEGVISFQESRNLTADGMVGAATRARLFDESQGGGDESMLPLSTGAKGDYVLYLQYGLRILCCSPGAIDGVFGSGTSDAVKKYQSKYGITETGVVNLTTWNSLKTRISDIQRGLINKGYDIPAVDGLASSALVETIKKFQEANWLTADGQVGPSTFDLLFSDISDGATDALPLKLKSRGPRVLYFQYALRICCINPNGTDGVFGAGTQSAVNRYKTNKGLTADGIVDTSTWEKMRGDIRPLQTALANRGYEVGFIDGIATEKVYNSVLQFQRDNNLTADGMIGNATKVLLLGGTDGKGTISSTLKLGSNGSLTRYLQRLLNESGYSVPINGVFSQETHQAAIAFQTANGLDADGVVGGGTWRKLFENYQVDVPGTGVEKLLNVAKHELEWGFAEDNANNITPYGQWYGMNGSAWCAMFVSYCAYQAGVIDTLVPKYAWCPSGMTWYKNHGRYNKRNSSYIPKKGDVVFFYNNELGRVAHTGIVIGGDDHYITTIEGNTTVDAVEKRTYSRNHTTIDGYGNNGGEAITPPLPPTEADYQDAISSIILEVITSIGFNVLPPFNMVENVDLPVFESANLRLTFKCKRGSSWYSSVESPIQLNFEYGVPTFGIDLTPNINVALEGVGDKEFIGGVISSLTISSEASPVKLEYSMEGEWQKISCVSETTIFEGEYHEDVVSYGYSIWIRVNNDLSTEVEKARQFSFSPEPEDIQVAVIVVCAAIIISAIAVTIFSGGTGSASLVAASNCALVLANATS